jgi:hypothetical protein
MENRLGCMVAERGPLCDAGETAMKTPNTKPAFAAPACSATWWDATGTKNVINACLQQIERLHGKLPMGVALSLQRAHTALRESLERVESLKSQSPNSGMNDSASQYPNSNPPS